MDSNPDFIISHGTNPTLNFTWPGTYAGDTLIFAVKGDLNAITPYALLKSGIANTVSGISIVNIPLLVSDTSIPPGFYYYDLTLIDTAGNVLKKQPGVFQLGVQVYP